MDQPPAVALTAFADAWPRATETEIGAALCAIRRGKDFDFDFDLDTEYRGAENISHCIHVCIDMRDIGMHQNILTYCYMAGMTHNTNQPTRTNEILLDVSFIYLISF